MSDQNVNTTRRASGKKKIFIVAGALGLALLAIAILALPFIAGSVARGIIASRASEQMSGSVAVDRVGLSWLGGQRVAGVTIRDPDGAEIGRLNASAGAGLISLATGSLDLGTLKLDGRLDLREAEDGTWNLQRALASPAGAAAPAPAPAPSTPAAPKPITLPKGLAFELDANGLAVSVTRAGGETVELKNIQVTGAFRNGAPVDLELTGQDAAGQQAVTLTLGADQLTTKDGELALAGSNLKVSFDVRMGPRDVAALAAVDLSPQDEGFRAAGAIQETNGRLTLTDPNEGIVVTARPPHELLQVAGGDDASVSIDRAPAVFVRLMDLDLPLPDPANPDGMSWLGSRIGALLEVEGIEGEIALPGEAPKRLSVQPMIAKLESDEKFNLAMEGGTTVSLGDQDAGAFRFLLTAAGIMDERGKLEPTKPSLARARLTTDALPTSLLQPFADKHDIDLNRLFGEHLVTDVRAGIIDRERMSPDEIALVSAEDQDDRYLAATIESEHTTVRADLYADVDHFRTRNKGIDVQTNAVGYLARRFGAGEGVAITGEGEGIFEITNLYLPQNLEGLTLGTIAADVRAVVGKLDAAIGDEAPIAVDTVDLSMTLVPGDQPTVGIDARASTEGRQFAIRGGGTIENLDMDMPVDAVDPARLASARPSGQVRLIDVPTSLAGLASPDLARLAPEAIGDRLGGVLISKPHPDGPAGRYAVGVELEAPRAAVVGHGSIDAERFVLGEPGLKVELYEPDRALAALNEMGVIPQEVDATIDGAAALTISGIDLPINDVLEGAPLRSTTATVRMQASQLAATINAQGGAQRVALDVVDATASIGEGRSVSLVASANGTCDAGPITAEADLSATGLLSETGAVDPDGAAFSGKATITGVPTSLAALADPNLVDLSAEAIGPTVDLTVEAQSRDTLALNLNAQHAQASSTLLAKGKSLELAGTTGRLSLTPQAAASAARFAGVENPPSLREPATITLSADSLAMVFGGESATPTARNVVVKSAAPIVFDSLGIDTGAGQQAMAIESLEATIASFGPDAVDGRATARLTDPNASGASLGTLDAELKRGADKALEANAVVTGVDVARLDAAFDTGGLGVALVGERLDATASTGREGVALAVDAPERLSINAKLVSKPDGGYELAGPVEAWWLAKKGVLQQLARAGGGEMPPLSLERDTKIYFDVERLAIGGAETPLAPDAFQLKAAVRVPTTLELGVLEDRGGQWTVVEPATIPPIELEAERGDTHDQIRFVVDRPSGGQGGGTTAFAAEGTIDGLADSSGRLTTDQATVTAQFDGAASSSLIDAVGGMDGMVNAVMGPSISTAGDPRSNVQRLSKNVPGGTMFAQATSENARVKVDGQVMSTSVVRLEPDTKLELTKITQEASDRLLGSVIPLFQNFRKEPHHDPALFESLGLDVPIDGDMAKLNGKAVVDLGVMQFEPGVLGSLLAIGSIDSFKETEKQFARFELTAKNGVISYPETEITANFVMITYGKVDLVRKKLDVYVLLPPNVLGGNIAKEINKVPVIGDVTTVPIRVHGDMSKPKIEPDIELMLKNVVESPGDLIDGILGGGKKKDGESGGGLLDSILGGGKKK